MNHLRCRPFLPLTVPIFHPFVCITVFQGPYSLPFPLSPSTCSLPLPSCPQLSVIITDVDPSSPPYVLTLRLFGRISPSQSRQSLLSTKVEIKLAKAEAIHWTGLEASARTSVVQPVNVSDGEKAQAYAHVHASMCAHSFLHAFVRSFVQKIRHFLLLVVQPVNVSDGEQAQAHARVHASIHA